MFHSPLYNDRPRRSDFVDWRNHPAQRLRQRADIVCVQVLPLLLIGPAIQTFLCHYCSFEQTFACEAGVGPGYRSCEGILKRTNSHAPVCFGEVQPFIDGISLANQGQPSCYPLRVPPRQSPVKAARMSLYRPSRLFAESSRSTASLMTFMSPFISDTSSPSFCCCCC